MSYKRNGLKITLLFNESELIFLSHGLMISIIAI